VAYKGLITLLVTHSARLLMHGVKVGNGQRSLITTALTCYSARRPAT